MLLVSIQGIYPQKPNKVLYLPSISSTSFRLGEYVCKYLYMVTSVKMTYNKSVKSKNYKRISPLSSS